MDFPQKKKKKEPPYDPAIQLFGISLKKYKSADNSDTCTPMFIAILFTIVKLWNQLSAHK
jgi:hypothetical protein